MKSVCKFFFLSNPLAPGLQDFGLLILRLFLGLALAINHGWGKLPPSQGFIDMVGSLGFPAPVVFAWLAAIAEFGGGALVVIGLATRFGATLIILVMASAILTAHSGDPFGKIELPLFFLTGAAALCFTGPGRFSIDRIIRR